MSSMYGGTGRMGGGNQVPKGYQMGQMQNFTPEQMNLFQNMFSHIGPDSYLSKLAGGDQGTFEQMEAPAMRQFAGLQGNLASRFSGMGMGARRSSGFQNTANQASSDFAQSLQSRRQELQSQAIRDLMGMSNQLLGQRPHENYLQENDDHPFWQKILGGALPMAGTAFGFTPWGAASGGPSAWGAIGSAAGKAFS